MATRDTYEVQTWENLPSETTPVNAERLAHIEQGIKDAADKRAMKEIYDDRAISLGRKEGTYPGNNSATVGYDVTAYGNNSYAGGTRTVAYANNSFASGNGTIANGSEQHVTGRYNVADNGIYSHIVGGGTSDTNRKNIHTLDWAGNAYFAGNVTNGAGVSLNSLKSAIDNLPTGGGVAAKVFDTKADLDAWMAVEGNTDTLVIGQNIYIKETDTPDYWWDGAELRVLETDKVEIESMTYEETMAILNATAEEVV